MYNTKKAYKKIRWDRIIKSGVIYFVLLLMVMSCDKSNVNMVKEAAKEDQEISQIDNEPIIKLQDAEFYHGDMLDNIRDDLAVNHGPAIVKALNDEYSSQQNIQAITPVSVQKLNSLVQRKENAPDIGSTHLRITEPDGESEDFVLSLRQYHHNPIEAARKGSPQLKASTTYLALSPDRFYLQDDEDGNEQWPVTFPAVSLQDSTERISVTFDKNGYVSSSLESKKSNGSSLSSNKEPSLVFVEATPHIEQPCDKKKATTNDLEPCDGSGGGGGGTGGGGGGDDSYCTEVSGRGGDTGGPTSGTQTYYTVNKIRLWATGDGDGHAELQMFVKQDDVYDGECFPRSYKYRFDKFSGEDYPVITSADGEDYRVPDVNLKDVDYDEFWYKDDEKVGYFPLFDLTHEPGPWRLVLSDDDKDYQDFSRRRQSDFAQDIQTYDMSSGSWSQVYTGFSTDRKTYGSSDDPIRESGVRRITESNASERGGYLGFDATKVYSGGYFSYSFSLLDK